MPSAGEHNEQQRRSSGQQRSPGPAPTAPVLPPGLRQAPEDDPPDLLGIDARGSRGADSRPGLNQCPAPAALLTGLEVRLGAVRPCDPARRAVRHEIHQRLAVHHSTSPLSAFTA